jgi:hypothetical protein
MVSAIVGREFLGNIDWNGRIHGYKIHAPVAARAAAFHRSGNPAILLHFAFHGHNHPFLGQ